MAPSRAPGLFKCAFGYVCVYDIEMMFDLGDIPRSESGRCFLRRTHGTSKAKWNESSPVRRAYEVAIPVYLAAGARDHRTPEELNELMNKAPVDAGNPTEGMITQSGETHGCCDEKNSLNTSKQLTSIYQSTN